MNWQSKKEAPPQGEVCRPFLLLSVTCQTHALQRLFSRDDTSAWFYFLQIQSNHASLGGWRGSKRVPMLSVVSPPFKKYFCHKPLRECLPYRSIFSWTVMNILDSVGVFTLFPLHPGRMHGNMASYKSLSKPFWFSSPWSCILTSTSHHDDYGCQKNSFGHSVCKPSKWPFRKSWCP